MTAPNRSRSRILLDVVLIGWLSVLTGLFLTRGPSGTTGPGPEPAEIAFTPEGFEGPVVRLAGAMPDPQVGGQVFPRSNVVSGLQFMDANGDELGGLGTIPEDRRAMILCFDHATAEAVCLTRLDEDVTFTIMQPPAPGSEVGVTGPQRLGFGVLPGEGLSYLRLMDAEGRVRIRMEVGADGEPLIETLDQAGSVVFTTR